MQSYYRLPMVDRPTRRQKKNSRSGPQLLSVRRQREQECLKVVKRLMDANGNRKPTGDEIAEEMGISRASAYAYLKAVAGNLQTVVVE